jgi:O-antigen biosynthesis protein
MSNSHITQHSALSTQRSAWPAVDIVVVNYNTGGYIADCLRSLLNMDYPSFNITVVDNASSDGSANLIAHDFPTVQLLRSESNLGFAGGCNLGMRAGNAPLVATLNPDARARPSWLREAVRPFLPGMGINPDALPSHLQQLDPPTRARVGIVGSKILYIDRPAIQHAGGNLSYPLAQTWHTGYGEPDNGQYDGAGPADFVTGAAMAISRAMLAELDYFDASFYPVYFEDVDLCFRAWAAGWQVRYEPRAVVLHHESVTIDRQSLQYFRYFERSRLRFVLKHYTHRQLFDDFVPAEAIRLAQDMMENDRLASMEIYSLTLPTQVGRRAGDSGGGLPIPTGQHTTPPDVYGNLKSKIEKLKSLWLVEEKPFASRTPGVAWLRTRLNNLGPRWYIKQILAQQVEYNAAVLQVLEELGKQMRDLQAATSVRDTVLTARLGEVDTRMEATIARTLARLAAMDDTLKQVSDVHSLLRRPDDQA